MKKIKAIISVITICLVLISTLGFSVNRHYCMGHLVEESLFRKDAGCGMEDMRQDFSSEDGISSNCCKDELIAIPGLNTNTPIEKALSYKAPLFSSPSHTYSLSKLHHRDSSPEMVRSNSPPSSISGRQLLVRVQRFLI